MKRTLKEQNEYLKKARNMFAVYSFTDGKREAGYIGVGPITAFETIAKHLADGKQVLITLASSDKDLINYEIEKKCRVPYDFAKQFAVRPDYNGVWTKVGVYCSKEEIYAMATVSNPIINDNGNRIEFADGEIYAKDIYRELYHKVKATVL